MGKSLTFRCIFAGVAFCLLQTLGDILVGSQLTLWIILGNILWGAIFAYLMFKLLKECKCGRSIKGKVQMKFIEASKKKDTHTEEWIVIILSAIFAYLINKLFLSLTNSDSITASLVVLIAGMSVFSITYYYGKDKLQQRLKSKK